LEAWLSLLNRPAKGDSQKLKPLIKRAKAKTKLGYPNSSEVLDPVKALPGYAGVQKCVALKSRPFTMLKSSNLLGALHSK
jgi:hypothetical protein